MAVKRSGLGRNLSALLSHVDTTLLTESPPNEWRSLDIHCLQPGKYQPRGDFDETALAELAESIRKQGLLQPIVVREIAVGRYEIIAGERRWRACKRLNMPHIPVILRQVDDETAMAMGLVENLQRESLNPLEQSRAMYRLTTEFALTHQQIAELLGQSRTAVSNCLRLLNLSTEVKQLLENGDLDMGHARCLLSLDEAQQNHVAKLVIARELSVRETEALVTQVKSGTLPSSPRTGKQTLHFTPLYQDKLRELSARLQAPVALKQGKAERGLLTIRYENQAALEQIMSLLFKE